MNFIKRTLYLGYYIKQMDWTLLNKFLTFTSNNTGKSKIRLLLESVGDVYSYNTSILEYFQFGFYDKTKQERSEWIGTGGMYEFQLIENPPKERVILDDKGLFYKNYGEFIRHQVLTVEEVESHSSSLDKLYQEHDKIVLKDAHGKGGKQVKIISTSQVKKEELAAYMHKHNYDIVESFVVQHPDLNKLSPSAVNTVRIITQLREHNEVEILGCRMRISVNCPVDNLASGNLAATIDEKTGIINGPGVYSDITKPSVTVHPVTNVTIVGYQIPYWRETIDLVKKAALKHTQNRSIGWDVVITSDGPELIEGNHDWCKLLWQLPAEKGLKKRLRM